MLYTVKKTTTTIKTIDKAFQAEDVTALEQIVTKHREITKNLYHLSSWALDECMIREDIPVAIKAFNPRNLQLAKYPCISCTKLCYRGDVTEIRACKLPLAGKAWNRFKEYYDSIPVIDDGLPDRYLCDYCIRKFRANELLQGAF